MARTHPEGWRLLPAGGRAGAARHPRPPLRRRVARGHHDLPRPALDARRGSHGGDEVDFAVVGPGGGCCWSNSRPASSTRDACRPAAPRQAPRGAAQRRARAQRRRPARPPAPAARRHRARARRAAALPDHCVRQPGTAGLDPERIVDAGRRDQLPAIVAALTRPREGDPALDAAHRQASTASSPTCSSWCRTSVAHRPGRRPHHPAVGRAHQWARRIVVEPHRLRVTATASDGDPARARRLHRRARRRPAPALRVLQPSARRPLRAYRARRRRDRHLPPACDRRVREAGRKPAFGAPGAFRRMEADFATLVRERPIPPGSSTSSSSTRARTSPKPWRDACSRC